MSRTVLVTLIRGSANVEIDCERAGSAQESASQLLEDNPSLSDAELMDSGFIRIQAFVRSEKSRSAERTRKAREKAAQSGISQVNVMAPTAAHPVFKSLASELQKGGTPADALRATLIANDKGAPPDSVVMVVSMQRAGALEQLASKLYRLTGWRRFIAKLVGLI